MRLLGWFRHRDEGNTEEAQPRRWTWLAGHRVLTNTPYIMPKDKAEGDRLNIQHHLVKVATGSNYHAPLRQPRSILDVACGTGVWAREMAQQFPRARVIGFDIDRTPLERSMEVLGPGGQFPLNFRFQQADALKPFPFEDEEFDFVHARFIVGFVPVTAWPGVISEIMRVTRRGGYVEMTEMAEMTSSPSQAYATLRQHIIRFMESRGLYAGIGDHLRPYLVHAGLRDAQEQRFVLGFGKDAKRQQRLLSADVLAGVDIIKPVLVKLGFMSEAECEAAAARAKMEIPQMGIKMPIVCVYGQKP
jgi:ubiquinone/menaquinone biosynthesis C-methylase UbiE